MTRTVSSPTKNANALFYGWSVRPNLLMNREQIINSVTGETLDVLESNAEVFKFKYELKPRGAIASAHLHPAQEQTITVVRGQLHCRIGDRPFVIRAGGSIVIPAGLIHDQWNPTDEKVIAIEEYRPAKRINLMFKVLFKLARDGQTDHKGVPYPLIGAAFVREFADVIRPARLRHRIVFGSLAVISRFFGYQRTIRQSINEFELNSWREARATAIHEGANTASRSVKV